VLSQQDCEAGGSLAWEMPGLGGKRPRRSRDVSALPDGAGPVGVAERYTGGTGVFAPQDHPGSNLADRGRRRRAPDAGHLFFGGGLGNSLRLFVWLRGGCGEVL